jgi:hypothetical protein
MFAGSRITELPKLRKHYYRGKQLVEKVRAKESHRDCGTNAWDLIHNVNYLVGQWGNDSA